MLLLTPVQSPTSHLLLPPLPVSRIASPAAQCSCLSLISLPSVRAVKIFPPSCVSPPSPPHPSSLVFLTPSHCSTSEYVQDHNSAPEKAGKDKEPKTQDSSLWNHLVACQQGKKKPRSFCLPILTCKQKKGDHKQSQCLFGGWVGKKSWKIKCGGRERSWSFEKREAN